MAKGLFFIISIPVDELVDKVFVHCKSVEIFNKDEERWMYVKFDKTKEMSTWLSNILEKHYDKEHPTNKEMKKFNKGRGLFE